MAYYSSLGKLLDGGYRFTEIWNSTSSPLNTSISGSTVGFKVGDIIMMVLGTQIIRQSGGAINNTLYTNGLYISGCKGIFSTNKRTPTSQVSPQDWKVQSISNLYVYIGQVLENTIVLAGSIVSDNYSTKLFKISDQV